MGARAGAISPDAVTLDLLIRQGNDEAVRTAAAELGLVQPQIERSVTEAYVYNQLTTWRRAGHVLHDAPHMFENARVLEYMASTSNIRLLGDLIGVLDACVNSGATESFELLAPYDILDIAQVASAIRRNRAGTHLRGQMEKIANRGYDLLFARDLERTDAEAYFPIVHRWSDCVDLQAVAHRAANTVADNLDIYDTEPEDLKVELSLLNRLVGRDRVSTLMLNQLGDTDKYRLVLETGLVDDLRDQYKRPEGVPANVWAAWQGYRTVRWPEPRHVEGMELSGEHLEPEARRFLGQQLAAVFGVGDFEHALVLAWNGGELYDADAAREGLSYLIQTATQAGDYDTLDQAMRLPAQLIDRERAGIRGFVGAYERNWGEGGPDALPPL